MSCEIKEKPLFPGTIWTVKSLTEIASTILGKPQDSQKCRLVSFNATRLLGSALGFPSNSVIILLGAYGTGSFQGDGLVQFFITDPLATQTMVFGSISETSGISPLFIQYAMYTWD